jgi:putrescine---pyruvate transaminase
MSDVSAFLHPFASPAKSEFITVVGGEGAVIWDDRGRRYIDGMASLWYMNVGHGREDMAEAIAGQARLLASYNTFDPWTNEPAERLAARVAELAPMPDGRVFFASSGSEAVDTAMKMARIAQIRAGHPERTVIISREHGYHGTNYGGTSAQGIALNREGWGPLVGEVLQVPSDNPEALAHVFAERSGEVAAVLTEPVQGAGGVYPPAPGYLQAVRRMCDEHGALLIADEVICGFGRLGTWFGSGFYDVEPDLVTFAKAVTSGYVPLSGVIVGRAVRETIESDPSFVLRTGYTYSGHPIACAAGLQNIEILADEGLLDRARAIGSRLGPALRSMEADGLVLEVRGEGAIWAVTMPEGRDAVVARNLLLEMGVIMRPLGRSLAMCPPLVITDDQIDTMMDALAEVMSA